MVGSHGRFVWYELITTDVAAAKAFYTKVIGWDAWDAPPPGSPYTFFTVGGATVGGLIELTEAKRRKDIQPSWLGYVGVNDVDAAADRIKRLAWGRACRADEHCGHQPLFRVFRPASRETRVAQVAEARPGAACRSGRTGPHRLARTARRRP